MTMQRGAVQAWMASALLAAALAGCGGGGGGGGGAASGDGQVGTATSAPVGTPVPIDTSIPLVPPVATAPAQPGPSGVEAACADCAAVAPNLYAGSGIGVWQKANTTGAALDVPVSISGLAGQDVTLVFTNEAATDAAFPAINLESQASASTLLSQRVTPPAEDPQAAIREFNRKGWADAITQARGRTAISRSLATSAPQAAAAYAVGSTRSFHHSQDQSTRTATLQVQATTGDGMQVRVWVESSEIGEGKVSAARASQLATTFARTGGIYDMLKAMGGPLWGPHGYADLISGSAQPLDIVVLNFDRNQRAYGLLGYFWSLHNLTKAVDSRSNESLSLYLDAETLYLDGEAGAKLVLSTLAHEGMHMSNFYRRGVLMGQQYTYDTWLEEMTAMMMEDAASAGIDSAYNATRDLRLRDYLSMGSYNCALKNWTPFAGTCESYAVNGSFGGFLLRQLGVGFYRNLLSQKQPGSEADLETAIRSVRAGSGIGAQLRRFAASTIGTLPAAAPAEFGFPARNEAGFSIPAIDVAAFAASRALPTATPAQLLAYANFPVLRRSVKGTYAETVRVPPGATLSVVVH